MTNVMADGSDAPLVDQTDWARVDATTDEGIERAVADDPDAAPILPDEEHARLVAEGKVWRRYPLDVRAIRERTGLSQETFALKFGLSLGSLRNWEQGRRQPEGAARALLQVIDREPEAVRRALSP